MYNLAASGGVGAAAASPVKDDELVKLDVVVGVALAAPAQALYACQRFSENILDRLGLNIRCSRCRPERSGWWKHGSCTTSSCPIWSP